MDEIVKLYFEGYSVKESLEMVINKRGDKMLRNFDFKINDIVKFETIDKRTEKEIVSGKIIGISKNERWASVEIIKNNRVEGIFFEDLTLVKRNIQRCSWRTPLKK